jgi:ATP-dependent helicase/nuclease subunit A
VIENDILCDIFAPDTLVEVPITAKVGERRLHGVVDRLRITDSVVQLIDYKTNRHVPPGPAACPEGILRQMGAYAAMLSQIFPDHEIRTAVLWTANATLMPLPHDLVTKAFAQSDHLDVGQSRS